MLISQSTFKITNVLELHGTMIFSFFCSELTFNNESYGILKTRQMEIALFISIWWGEWLGVERETLKDDNVSIL